MQWKYLKNRSERAKFIFSPHVSCFWKCMLIHYISLLPCWSVFRPKMYAVDGWMDIVGILVGHFQNLNVLLAKGMLYSDYSSSQFTPVHCRLLCSDSLKYFMENFYLAFLCPRRSPSWYSYFLPSQQTNQKRWGVAKDNVKMCMYL